MVHLTYFQATQFLVVTTAYETRTPSERSRSPIYYLLHSTPGKPRSHLHPETKASVTAGMKTRDRSQMTERAQQVMTSLKKAITRPNPTTAKSLAVSSKPNGKSVVGTNLPTVGTSSPNGGLNAGGATTRTSHGDQIWSCPIH